MNGARDLGGIGCILCGLTLLGVAGTGGDDDEFDIYTFPTAAISHAQKRVWITQAYFAPDEAFIEILKEVSRRGVDVRLLQRLKETFSNLFRRWL